MFSPWQYNIDDAARRLFDATGWVAPHPDVLPTGHELIDDYLEPLAETLGDRIQTDAHVMVVSRDGIDKTRSAHRADAPLLVRIRTNDGIETDLTAQAVLDASGKWEQPNPLGRSGLVAPGEHAAYDHGQINFIAANQKRSDFFAGGLWIGRAELEIRAVLKVDHASNVGQLRRRLVLCDGIVSKQFV